MTSRRVPEPFRLRPLVLPRQTRPRASCERVGGALGAILFLLTVALMASAAYRGLGG